MTKINKENYKESVANAACVVIFTAPWCRDCMVLKPILERLEPEFSDKINFFAVDFDTEENLKDELNIRRIPTMIFYKNGEETGQRLVEPDSQEVVKTALSKLIS